MAGRRRADDAYTRYYLRKAVKVLVAVAVLVALAVGMAALRGPSPGHPGLRHGWSSFAMQEVIGAKAIFNEPVFNSSAAFDYLWEELTIPVPYSGDWQRAEQILREEAQRRPPPQTLGVRWRKCAGATRSAGLR